MDNDKFMEYVQNRVAELAVSESAVRNQGASGIPIIARSFLKKLDIKKYHRVTKRGFNKQLNNDTRNLMNKLPPNAQNWGAARKMLNLFLRDILYNQYLCERYRFYKIERWLEVPLDSQVSDGIKSEYPSECLPRFPGIKHLKQQENKKYQDAALWIAKKYDIARVHLDLVYWRKG